MTTDKDKHITEHKISLTQGQQLLWVGQQLSPSSPLYNMAFIYRFNNHIDVEKFQTAFQLMLQQSEINRSRFLLNKGEAEQWISASLLYELPYLDLSVKEQPDEALTHWLQTSIQKKFNLQEILFDSAIIKIANQEYIWYLNQHHLITDAWSKTVQYKLVINYYQQLLSEEEVSVIKLPSFEKFVNFENKKRTTLNPSTITYWDQKESSLPAIPSLFDKQNPLGNTLTHRVTIRLSKEKTSLLRANIKKGQFPAFSEHLSFFTFFLSILYLASFKRSGQTNLTIGTPIHNRNTPDFKNTIGMFIELFPINITIEKGETFLALFEKVRNEYYTFMRHAQTGSSRASLNKKFNIVINYINATYEEVLGLDMESHWLDSHHADPMHHLKLQVYDFDTNGEIEFLFDANTAIFTKDQLQQLSTEFVDMVSIFIENPTQEIFTLNSKERAQIQHFNSTTIDFPKEETIVSLFNKTVAQYPEKVALIFEDQELTYRELDQRSNQLAHHLVALGVKKEELIVISLDRGFEMIVGLLGILKSGAVFVPVDPTYPQKRIDYTLEDTQAKFVVTTQKYASVFEGKAVQTIALDKASEQLAVAVKTPVAIELQPQNLMYVLYTSGSTGQPKGVMNEHGALVNRLYWAQQYFGLDTRATTILQKTTFCFDVSVWELFLPLITGHPMVLARPEGQKDNTYLQSIIESQQVNMVHFVPSMLEVFLLDVKAGDCPNLRQVICSGEELKPHQVQAFQHKLPHVDLYNLYGPTEAAIDVTACKVEDPTTITIGQPVYNTQIAILNELGMECPIGVKGELYIGGIQVARGYHNKPDLTEERFIEFNNQRCYKTGDAAAWMSDGHIKYLGRLDTQVKIRGFRVEVAEVEITLSSIAGVTQSAVVIRADQFETNYLVAYVVLEINRSTSEILADLKNRLPNYMVPSHIVALKELPLNSNGKLDRSALPAPETISSKRTEYVAARNEFEEIIQAIWTEVLQIDQISVLDEFIDVGGESLTGLRIISRLRATFELPLSTSLIFQKTSIAQQAIYIEETMVKILEAESGS